MWEWREHTTHRKLTNIFFSSCFSNKCQRGKTNQLSTGIALRLMKLSIVHNIALQDTQSKRTHYKKPKWNNRGRVKSATRTKNKKKNTTQAVIVFLRLNVVINFTRQMMIVIIIIIRENHVNVNTYYEQYSFYFHFVVSLINVVLRWFFILTRIWASSTVCTWGVFWI